MRSRRSVGKRSEDRLGFAALVAALREVGVPIAHRIR